MLDVEVITDPAAAAAALDPVKARLLSHMTEPASAATLAPKVGLTRQKANYHLKGLEELGLVEAAGSRRWGGLTERLLVATARGYVVAPDALGPIAADPGKATDQKSAAYLIALAARIVREVGGLWRRAREEDKRLATLSIQTEITFKDAAARADFTRDLAEAVTALAGRYHQGPNGGRTHRLLIAAYPKPGGPQSREYSA